MSRGKPAPDQLDLSMDLLRLPIPVHWKTAPMPETMGSYRVSPNAGSSSGICSDTDRSDYYVGGNASLNLMFDTMAFLFLFGTGGNRPWADYRTVGRTVRFFMPGSRLRPPLPYLRRTRHRNDPRPASGRRPGYEPGERTGQKRRADQGHLVCPAALQPAGCLLQRCCGRGTCFHGKQPRMISGFSGTTYGIHHIYEEVPLKDILTACEKAGHPNRCYYFFSTSKITFSGSRCFSDRRKSDNIKSLGHMSAQTISHDKLNQLRHVQFFGTPEKILIHMQKLADLLRPKFDIVLQKLEEGIGQDSSIASWSRPKGGYFISLKCLRRMRKTDGRACRAGRSHVDSSRRLLSVRKGS